MNEKTERKRDYLRHLLAEGEHSDFAEYSYELT
jgi:hypothetical protein